MSTEAWWYYGGIWLLMFLTGVGLPPAPEEAGIIAAGGLAAAHAELRWWLALPACLAGIIAADMVLYSVGFVFRRHLFDYRLVRRFVPSERQARIEEGFRRHGVKILITGRLLPGVRTGVFLVAGAVHFPLVRFLLADALFAVFGVSLFFFGSYLLVDQFKLLLDQFHQVQNWLLLLAIAGGVGYVLYRYVRFLKQRVQAGDLAPPTLPELVHLESRDGGRPPPATTPQKQFQPSAEACENPRDCAGNP